jgi:hypothetical protein
MSFLLHTCGRAGFSRTRLVISCRYQCDPVHYVDIVLVSMYLPCFPPPAHETASPSLARVPQAGSPGLTVL